MQYTLFPEFAEPTMTRSALRKDPRDRPPKPRSRPFPTYADLRRTADTRALASAIVIGHGIAHAARTPDQAKALVRTCLDCVRSTLYPHMPTDEFRMLVHRASSWLRFYLRREAEREAEREQRRRDLRAEPAGGLR